MQSTIHPIFFSFFHETTFTYLRISLSTYLHFTSLINNHRTLSNYLTIRRSKNEARCATPNRIQISAQIESGLRASFVMLRNVNERHRLNSTCVCSPR